MTLAVLLVPNPHLDYREHGEILYDHGLAPLFAVFLWAASRDTSASSKASRLFAHPALSSIGKCSFEVYLFQWPIHAIFYGVGLPTAIMRGEFYCVRVDAVYAGGAVRGPRRAALCAVAARALRGASIADGVASSLAAFRASPSCI